MDQARRPRIREFAHSKSSLGPWLRTGQEREHTGFPEWRFKIYKFLKRVMP